ncbi:hypothetical protein PBY51_004617 [Eleginops maclovinus]|uniref:Uncharacterized protein n=1 Tax=Eleginops maclovinus TaxID=56733 RepID=A0AAN7XX71_ELEMC|nr:hypothetical protein PBY51_004617 [Eleginops maclovinus]
MLRIIPGVDIAVLPFSTTFLHFCIYVEGKIGVEFQTNQLLVSAAARLTERPVRPAARRYTSLQPNPPAGSPSREQHSDSILFANKQIRAELKAAVWEAHRECELGEG